MEFRKTTDVLNHAVKRLTSVKNDIKNRLEDSVQAGLVAEAESLDAQLREIEEIERDLESNKTDWKINLGEFTSPGGKNVDINPHNSAEVNWITICLKQSERIMHLVKQQPGTSFSDCSLEPV